MKQFIGCSLPPNVRCFHQGSVTQTKEAVMSTGFKNLRMDWKQVAMEAVRRPMTSGLGSLAIGALHLGAGALMGHPYLLKWGIAWSMMGSSDLILFIGSKVNPDITQMIRQNGSPKTGRHKLNWREVAKQTLTRPFSSGLFSTALGTFGLGYGFVIDAPIAMGGGLSLLQLGTHRMSNTLNSMRYPALNAA